MSEEPIFPKNIAYILGIKKVYKVEKNFIRAKSIENIIDTDNLFSILKILFCNMQKNNDILREILKKDNKFQDSMKKEAIRLEFAEKREKYKKHMRQSTSMTSDRTISGTSAVSNIKEPALKLKSKKTN